MSKNRECQKDQTQGVAIPSSARFKSLGIELLCEAQSLRVNFQNSIELACFFYSLNIGLDKIH